MLRNTAWARRFLARWWARRCGFYDQYGLWRALFEAWKEEGFAYDPSVFADYAAARRKALEALVEGLGALVPAAARWPCAGDCRRTLRLTGCLVEPLELPHVAVLPVQPFHDRGRVVPPLQARVGSGWWADAWFCHGFCHNASGDVWGRPPAGEWAAFDRRGWASVRRWVQKRDDELKTCYKPKSDVLYTCDCARVAALRLAAMVGAVAREG